MLTFTRRSFTSVIHFCYHFEKNSCAFRKKNAEIYIQRARRAYSNCMARTRLLELEMRGLEVIVLADPSMQGKEAIRNLKDLDCFSPWPPDSQLDFTTLWCRWIKLESETFTVNLRDFPQSLLDIQGGGTFVYWVFVQGCLFFLCLSSQYAFFKTLFFLHCVPDIMAFFAI